MCVCVCVCVCMYIYVLRTSIDKIRENGFELTKKRSRRYPAKTITDADYADDIGILANKPNQAETLLIELVSRPVGAEGLLNAHTHTHTQFFSNIVGAL